MVQIREAEPRDVASLMSFDLFSGDRVSEVVDRRMLVAETDGGLVGYIAWQHGGCIGKDYVNKLVVRDDCRRLGIATGLLNGLSMKLRGRVFISAGSSNGAAIALLQANGWLRAGEITGLHSEAEAEIFFMKDV